LKKVYYNGEIARVAKWQTHYLEVVAPKGVEVRLLSRAQLTNINLKYIIFSEVNMLNKSVFTVTLDLKAGAKIFLEVMGWTVGLPMACFALLTFGVVMF
jgi:hypothetical protein